jgi:hypothetical protein
MVVFPMPGAKFWPWYESLLTIADVNCKTREKEENMENESGTLTERQNNAQLVENILECLHVLVLRHWVRRSEIGVVGVFVLGLPSPTSIQRPFSRARAQSSLYWENELREIITNLNENNRSSLGYLVPPYDIGGTAIIVLIRLIVIRVVRAQETGYIGDSAGDPACGGFGLTRYVSISQTEYSGEV